MYHQYPPNSSSRGGPDAPPPSAKQNSFKKGLGFFPSSLVRSTKDPMFDMVKTPPGFSNKSSTPSEKKESSSGYSIPLIDLNQIAKADPKEKRRFIQTLGIALTQVGLVALKIPHFLPTLERVNTTMRQYFHQPLQQKILDWQGKGSIEGFSIQEQETSSKTEEADSKETYTIPQNFNQWPKKWPSFSRVMREYQDVLNRYSLEIMSYLLEYLGRPVELMEKTLPQMENILRLTYYPRIRNCTTPQAIWDRTHIDRSDLTLLSPGTIPGMQIKTSQGHWLLVTAPDDALIVMIGSQMEWRTAGLIKARPHRVINPGGQWERMERFDTQFFLSWNAPRLLSPLANCVELVTGGMTPTKKAAYLKKYS